VLDVVLKLRASWADVVHHVLEAQLYSSNEQQEQTKHLHQDSIVRMQPPLTPAHVASSAGRISGTQANG
jgi:hypothetical protein